MMFRRMQIMVGIMAIVIIGGVAIAEDLKITVTPPWQEVVDNGQKCYTLDYSGKDYPNLSLSVPVEADSYYRLSWDMSSSIADEEAKSVLNIDSNRKCTYIVPLSQGWNRYVGYFYNDSAKEAKLLLRPNPPSLAKRIEVKNLKFEKLKPESFTANLLPDGNFENSSGHTGIFECNADPNLVSVVSGQDFISGEKSLCLSFPQQEKVSNVTTIYLPVIPGKEFVFKFFAKADSEYTVRTTFSLWSPYGHQGKHFWKKETFKLSPEWKEYSMTATMPTDAAEYPDISDRMLAITIHGSDKQAGKTYFDEMEFKQVEQK